MYCMKEDGLGDNFMRHLTQPFASHRVKVVLIQP